MAVRANPRLVEELEQYGAQDVHKCYHCGNCSAVCPFSRGPFLFPRKSMRYLQMGLEQKLLGTLEPWLCYYCGECSEQCPREAEPGETMMSMRRWLTSRYDFTGISKLFYRPGGPSWPSSS
jgi:heterodisulfide reductase subunit C/quinone-modifying oxidoreductase subunit QmoC